jgi:hypothetical protein
VALFASQRGRQAVVIGGHSMHGVVNTADLRSRVSTFEWWTTIISFATGAMSFAALVFLGIQLRQARREAREGATRLEDERRRRRKKETIEAIASTTELRLRLKKALPWNDGDEAEVKAFLKDAESDHQKKEDIRAYLDYLELLAVGVNKNVLDLETLVSISGRRIMAISHNYGDYIANLREDLNSSTLYSELDTLARAIMRHERTGAPAYNQQRLD